jgi:hypothetical protein
MDPDVDEVAKEAGRVADGVIAVADLEDAASEADRESGSA